MVSLVGLFLVLLFVIVSLIGIILLIVGVVLDVKWNRSKRKHIKVSKVHKIFAIILTSAGVLMGIGPSAFLGILYVRQGILEQRELFDLSDADYVYVDSIQDISANGFDFHGEHYVRALELVSSISNDNYMGNKVGAIIFRADNSHRLVYSVANLNDVDILYIESFGALYVKENEMDVVIDYYLNDAPLYASICNMTSPAYTQVDDIDSERVRQIVNRIDQTGSDTNPNTEVLPDTDRGRITFFSTDRIYMFMVDYRLTSDGIVLSWNGKYMLLDGEDAEYVNELINVIREN